MLPFGGRQDGWARYRSYRGDPAAMQNNKWKPNYAASESVNTSHLWGGGESILRTKGASILKGPSGDISTDKSQKSKSMQDENKVWFTVKRPAKSQKRSIETAPLITEWWLKIEI